MVGEIKYHKAKYDDITICPQRSTETHSDNLCKCFTCDRKGCKDGHGFKGCMIFDKDFNEHLCSEICQETMIIEQWIEEERAKGENVWRKETVKKLTRISKYLRAL